MEKQYAYTNNSTSRVYVWLVPEISALRHLKRVRSFLSGGNKVKLPEGNGI